MISKNLSKRLITSFLLFFLTLAFFKVKFIFIYTLLVLGIISILEFLNITKKFIKKGIIYFIINSSFIIYVIFFSFLFLFFYNNYHTKIVIFSVLLTCIASDIGGFTFGKIFKGPKLTKISPNKTISGAIGSLFFSCLVLSYFFNFISVNFNLKILATALITSISCQIGDLLFSYLKRKAKIKDTGNFLPGHGGALDRLDGIFIGVPIGMFSIMYL